MWKFHPIEASSFHTRAFGAMVTRLTSTPIRNNSILHQKIAGSSPAGLIMMCWSELSF